MPSAVSNAVSGLWSSPSSWVGGVVPGVGFAGDITIVHGAVIRSDGSQSFGDDSTAVMLTFSGNGSLILDPSITFTVKGSVSGGSGYLARSKGSIFEWGAAIGATPFYMNGFTVKDVAGADAPVAGNRSRFRGRSVANNSYIYASTSAQFDVAFCYITGLGNSSTPSISPGNGTGQMFRFLNCEVSDCGTFGNTGGPNTDLTGTYVADRCTFKNGRSGTLVNWWHSGTLTTGTRQFTNNVVDGVFGVGSAQDLTATENFLGANISLGASPGVAALWDRNLYRMTHIGATTGFWDWKRTYLFTDGEFDNAHGVYPSELRDFTIDGTIVDMPFLTNATDWGEHTSSSGAVPTSPILITVKNCVMLPVMVGSASNGFAAKGAHPVCLFDWSATPQTHYIDLIHNTFRIDNGGLAYSPYGTGVIFNESGTSSGNSNQAGSIRKFKDNLIWATGGAAGLALAIANHGGGGALTGIDNILDPAGATNNALFGLGTASALTFPGAGKTNVGTAYGVQTTGVTPGANDVHLVSAPTFTDPSRNLITWGRTKLGLLGNGDAQAPADCATILALMKAVNDDGADTSWGVADLYDWVALGWRPTTEALRGAAHDGTDIGAFAMAGPAPGPTGVIAVTGNTGRFGFATAQIGWEDDGSGSYRVYQSESLGPWNLVGSTVARLTQLRREGLKSSTGYRWKVRGVVGGIESADSAIVGFTTEAVVPDGVAPVISFAIITPSTIKIILTTTPACVAYFRSDDGGITFRPTAICPTTDTMFDDGLTPATTYIYRIGLYGKTGGTSTITQVSYTTLARPVGTPAEPTGLTVTPNINGIHVDWTNPAGSEIEVDRAYYDPPTFGPGVWSNIALLTAGATSYVDTTFLQRRGVYYRVRAKSGSNRSDYITPVQKMISTPGVYRNGITVDVGYGTANPVLTNALLDALSPGDTLAFHWDGSTPIRRKFNLSGCGTPAHKITVRGIAASNGLLPIIDGQNAIEVGTSASGDLGLITIEPKSTDVQGYKPSEIEIRDLTIRNARADFTYTRESDGAVVPYNDSAACVRFKTALKGYVRHCSINNGANLVGQGTGPYDRYYSDALVIEGCEFDQWGYDPHPGDPLLSDPDRRHGLYLDGRNIVVIGNKFLSCRPGTSGMAAKIRSANGFIGYNEFWNDSKYIDLIDPGAYQLSHYIRDPNYHRGEIVGNRFYAGPLYGSSRAILGGFDDDYYGCIDGPFYIHGNTLVSVGTDATIATRPYIYLFRSNNSGVDVRRVGAVEWGNANVSLNTDGGTPRDLASIEGDGTLQHGKSWYSHTPTDSGRTGITVGRGAIYTSGPPNPGFVDLLGGDYRPDVGSPLIDAFVPGPADATEVAFEPLGVARVQTGAARDLGAYEAAGTPAPTPSIPPVWPFGPARRRGVYAPPPPPPPDPAPIPPVWPFGPIRRRSSPSYVPTTDPGAYPDWAMAYAIEASGYPAWQRAYAIENSP